MHMNVNFGFLPVEAVLFVTDILDRRTGNILQHLRRNGFGAANLAGENHPVGGAKRFDRDTRQRIGAEKFVDHGI